MHIQFDQEDIENPTIFTFDNSNVDQEQMSDFLSWLSTLNLSFNKFKFRPPGSKSNSEKITCIAIDNQVVSKQDLQVNLVNQEVVAIKQEVVTSNTDKINDSESDSESESDSDHDSEIIPKTKKTTKRVTKK